jgi:hypothetical protein
LTEGSDQLNYNLHNIPIIFFVLFLFCVETNQIFRNNLNKLNLFFFEFDRTVVSDSKLSIRLGFTGKGRFFKIQGYYKRTLLVITSLAETDRRILAQYHEIWLLFKNYRLYFLYTLL